jgi:hypothetical protein
MRTGNTPMRGIRVSDKLWNDARKRAAKDETTVTEVIKRALMEYVKSGK